jgi:hypothetical protein
VGDGVTARCCNRRVTHYRRLYGLHSWEEGYRCKRCGRIRIPISDSFDGSTYRADVARIRAELFAAGEISEL